jgi:hypothetical protein
MIEIGYQLSSEEHPARDLVGYARRAEESGFSYAVVSDHFHAWTHRQGQSPFVWAVLGAIAQVTKRLRLGTAVTAPIRRTPPALVAHASATVATLLPGRFFLGVGSGENLNEHITGERPSRSSFPRTRSARVSSVAPTRTSTWPGLPSSPPPGSTTCTFTRSGPTRRRSSASTSARCSHEQRSCKKGVRCRKS